MEYVAILLGLCWLASVSSGVVEYLAENKAGKKLRTRDKLSTFFSPASAILMWILVVWVVFYD